MIRTVLPAAIDVRPPAALGAADWDDAWELTNRYYNTDRPFAEGKLRTSREIALLRSPGDGALVGVVALDVYPVEFRGRSSVVIFTSHAILDEGHRGQNLFQRLGVQTFLRVRRRFPLRPVYWLFDTFSYKSYVALARNFREFWPRFDRPTPEPIRELIGELAARQYGAAWRAERGVVERSGRKRLRAQTAPLDERARRDPHVDFFARANPRHAEGDMLVCLCPLTVPNMLTVGFRAVRRALRRRPARPPTSTRALAG